MIRKFATIAVLAGAALTLAAPANAAAYFIGGKWYYFSLNFEALIKQITGKDLNAGTFVGAEVIILNADTACFNPQTKRVMPGEGPKGSAYGESPDLTEGDVLDKDDRQKRNIFTTTATITDLVPEGDRLRKDLQLCKTVPGEGSWVQMYWQDRNCSKGLPADQLTAPVCYKELAYFAPDGQGPTLTYATGPDAGSPVPFPADWTFVYLPIAFEFKAFLDTDTGEPYSTIYGACQFPLNNEAGATKPGEQYSFLNPPVNGWAASPPVSYECAEIPASDYGF